MQPVAAGGGVLKKSAKRIDDSTGLVSKLKYFEKTPDSLRFPTFKGIRDYE